MPIVKVEQGDLLQKFMNFEFDGIIHGCNCFHVMGAGVAGQIARRFPEAYEADKQSLLGAKWKLGEYTAVDTVYGRIFNAYTQFKPGRENELRLYDSIVKAFSRINEDCYGGFRLGIPKIGAGIAGGDWDVISHYIDAATPKVDLVLVEYVG